MKSIKWIQALPFIIYTIAIFYVSNQPQAPFDVNIFWSFDKVLHLFAYFIYYICCIFFINALSKKYTKLKPEKYSLIISMVFAISDEFHQYFIPGRSAEIGDILADFTGIFLAFLLCRFFILKLPLFENGKR